MRQHSLMILKNLVMGLVHHRILLVLVQLRTESGGAQLGLN